MEEKKSSTEYREIERQNLNRVRQVGIELAMMNGLEINAFLKAYFSNADSKNSLEFIDKANKFQFKDQGRWAAVDKWIEGTLNKHPNYTPSRVAHMACVFWKIPFTLEPFLRKKARLIKRRLTERRNYQILKQISEY